MENSSRFSGSRGSVGLVPGGFCKPLWYPLATGVALKVQWEEGALRGALWGSEKSLTSPVLSFVSAEGTRNRPSNDCR